MFIMFVRAVKIFCAKIFTSSNYSTANMLGYPYDTSGTIIDKQDTSNRKQEHIAIYWAYSKLITFDALIDAFDKGYRNLYEYAYWSNRTIPS